MFPTNSNHPNADMYFSWTLTTIDVVYLDYWMGFDNVSHEDMLIILWNIGITGSWILLKDYLTNTYQLTSIDGVS